MHKAGGGGIVLRGNWEKEAGPSPFPHNPHTHTHTIPSFNSLHPPQLCSTFSCRFVFGIGAQLGKKSDDCFGGGNCGEGAVRLPSRTSPPPTLKSRPAPGIATDEDGPAAQVCLQSRWGICAHPLEEAVRFCRVSQGMLGEPPTDQSQLRSRVCAGSEV